MHRNFTGWFEIYQLAYNMHPNISAKRRHKNLLVALKAVLVLKAAETSSHQFYGHFNRNKLQPRYKFQSSVIFSVQFD